ncbi:MAG: hypothetical protein US74_C0023G0020 [Parcubacteria group bacterium GW2011_GWA2_38_13]|nr:MAG: hypothetical protein US74_C0023G0020 [Parcubacteria group bacterium GW2011_GWA2_38_13]
MRHYPNLQFKTDKKFDTEICADFINEKIGDYDFGYERIISLHPDLEKIRHIKKIRQVVEIQKYVGQYYIRHEKEITKSLSCFERAWSAIASRYFIEIEKIFGVLNFYKPDTINGLASIFTCGVIDDNFTSFQIWYKVKDIKEIRRHISHEILHFYYYTYIKKHFPGLVGNWDMAEIFNVVILNLPQFQSIIGTEERGYEIHESRFQKYKNIWRACNGELDLYLSHITQEPLK